MPNSLLHLGALHLPLFGLFAAAGIIAGLSLSQRTAGLAQLPREALWDAGMAAVFSAYLISRVLLLLENLRSFLAYPLLLLTVPSLTPGGLVLTAVLMLVYLRRKSLPLLPTLDAFAAPAALVWSLVALGDLASGDREGTPTRLPWALSSSLVEVHPVEIYTALCALGLCVFLYRRLACAQPPGRILAEGLLLGGVLVFFLDFFRLPDPRAILPLLDPIQWLAVSVVLAGGLLEAMTPSPAFPRTPEASPNPSPPGPTPDAL